MNKEQLAERLNGRQYGEEISRAEECEASSNGLVVIFGHSDDNVELRGAISDELGAYDGTTLRIHSTDVLPDHCDCECRYCGWERIARQCATIKAIWDEDGYSWTYSTSIPHACFDILEDDDKFCRGIVIDTKDLPQVH